MTDDKPDTSVISSTDSASAASADEDRWLTYLNYDRAIQQAVRRLGALSSANVDEFRALLLKGRDRSRVNDYEAESIRRLQGEAFVGDEDLQRTLIVLNAEDPRLGEELKRVVAANGKPQELDQMVAAIRAQIDPPTPPAATPATRAPRDRKPAIQAAEIPAPAIAQEPPHWPQPAAIPVMDTQAEPQSDQKTFWAKRLALPGAIAAAAAVALFFVLPRFMADNSQKTAGAETVPLRASSSDDSQPAPPDAPAPVAQPAPPVAPAPQADSPKPVPETASAAEPSRAAPAKAAAAPPTPDAPPTPMPVPGASYRVVRGDMLSAIALQAYHDASKFHLIQQANPSLRNKPDLILVDQTIFVPPAP